MLEQMLDIGQSIFVNVERQLLQPSYINNGLAICSAGGAEFLQQVLRPIHSFETFQAWRLLLVYLDSPANRRITKIYL